MKQLLSLLFALSNIYFLSAQCPSSSLTLTTQADIDNFAIQYPDCTVMPHNIIIGGSDITNLNGLSNLTSIQGNLKIGDINGGVDYGTSITNMQGLNSLNSIDGYLYITGNDNLINLSGLESLTSIGTYLFFRQNNAISNLSELSNLTNVGTNVTINSNNNLLNLDGLENLTSIGSGIIIGYNNSLINLNALANIENFNGNLIIQYNPELESIMDINNADTLGNLTILGNNDLTDLSALQSAQTITGDLTIQLNESLTNTIGLENIATISGDFNLKSNNQVTFCDMSSLQSVLGVFEISGNDNLIGFNFNNLILTRTIKIETNESLVNLDGFSSANQFYEDPDYFTYLHIADNNSLTNIDGISNFDLTNLDRLYIWGNPQLSFCGQLNICQYLINGGPISIFEPNGEGCNTFDEIITQCTSNYNVITGNAIYDYNDNGCDAGDLAVTTSTLSVSATNGIDTLTTHTNSEGLYTIFVSEGTYSTSSTPIVNSSFLAVSPESYSSDFTGFGNTDIHNFCVTTSGNLTDLQIAIIPEEDPRPGSDIIYHVIVENVGTNTENGIISFQFDNLKQTFVSASQQPESQTINELTFDYSDLQAFQTIDIAVVMNTLTNPDVNGGDEIVFYANLTTSNDINVSNNTYELTQIVVNSFDPNDKQVLQGNAILIDDISNYLDYRIRFQNTGTADAIIVRITDELSDKLDWSTFQPITASHDYRIQITEPQFVEFIFDNINLPPEQDDVEESQGFITFRVKPRSDVVVGDIISGESKIYFDFNSPIITNTVNTEILTPLSVDEFNTASFLIHPNPVDDILYIKSEQRISKISLFNNLGQEILTKNHSNSVDVSKMPSGIYILKLTNFNNDSQVHRIIKN